MRELVWALVRKKKDMKKAREEVSESLAGVLQALDEASGASFSIDKDFSPVFREVLTNRLKDEVDTIGRKLVSLRLSGQGKRDRTLLRELSDKERHWKESIEKREFGPELEPFLPEVLEKLSARKKELEEESKHLSDALAWKKLVGDGPALWISLHLSGHGDGIGAFHTGWMFPLRPEIDRSRALRLVRELLNEEADRAAPMERSIRYWDVTGMARTEPPENFLPDRPFLGAEVGCLAGIPSITLATTHDLRHRWGTPVDTLSGLDAPSAETQAALAGDLVKALGGATDLATEALPQKGFGTLLGQAHGMRLGELFPDRAEAGNLIMVYQGMTRFYDITGWDGGFAFTGLATKKQVFHKAIVEGFRLEPRTGRITHAIDKEKTGKNRYRVKMRRPDMETDLVFFPCRDVTLFDILEPRSLRPMTRLKVLDGRTDTEPIRYGYSRIDTRTSTLATLFVDKDTPFKLLMSDTLLETKMLLTNATEENPHGGGYPSGGSSRIDKTTYRAARDMWAINGPRVRALSRNGIEDERIHDITRRGEKHLSMAGKALAAKRYDRFFENASASLALAARVYNYVDRTRMDITLGVLFYIALFVPFSFCLERLLFSLSDIRKRIAVFLMILLATTLVVYLVHPAFRLAASPIVVILSFFVIGLAIMVSLILFRRFEAETRKDEAFGARRRVDTSLSLSTFFSAFLLGVTNLRRRPMRTALTITTLTILTFTVMSFTSVKTVKTDVLLPFSDQAAFEGLLMKNIRSRPIPMEAFSIFDSLFTGKAAPAHRSYLDSDDLTGPFRPILRYGGKRTQAGGIVGLSYQEPEVSGIDQYLMSGSWFDKTARFVIILSDLLAHELGLEPSAAPGKTVNLWGIPYKISGVYDSKTIRRHADLDGESIGPAVFPNEAEKRLSEVELDAIDSGGEIQQVSGQVPESASGTPRHHSLRNSVFPGRTRQIPGPPTPGRQLIRPCPGARRPFRHQCLLWR